MRLDAIEAGLRNAFGKDGFCFERTVFGAIQVSQGDYNILRIYDRPDGVTVHLPDGTESIVPQPVNGNLDKIIYNETEKLTDLGMRALVEKLGGEIYEDSAQGPRLFRFKFQDTNLSVLFELDKVRVRPMIPSSSASFAAPLTIMEKQLPIYLAMFICALRGGFNSAIEL